MKITKRMLKQLVKEETDKVLSEGQMSWENLVASVEASIKMAAQQLMRGDTASALGNLEMALSDIEDGSAAMGSVRSPDPLRSQIQKSLPRRASGP